MAEEIKTITPPNCINCGTPLVKHKEKDYYVCPTWKPNGAGCKGDIWYPDGTRQKNYPNIAISYKVESRSNPGHFYQVKIYESGDITCECMAGEMQKFCYHKQTALKGIERLIDSLKKKYTPKKMDRMVGKEQKIIPVSKLYQDKYADLRDYEVEEALKENQNAVVVYMGRHMTLSPEDLQTKKLLLNKSPINSKVNLGQQYFLFSYLWQPDPEETETEKLIRFSRECL